MYVPPSGETFIKGNVAITSTGVAIRDSPKSFTVVYEELQIGETIGRGSSSVVLRGIHTPSGTQLALKVGNGVNRFGCLNRHAFRSSTCSTRAKEISSFVRSKRCMTQNAKRGSNLL